MLRVKGVIITITDALSESEKLKVAGRLFPRGVRSTTGCLEWTGASECNGYGRIKINGVLESTHRVAWALKIGPINVGLWVLHKCDNPKCFDVSHLFLGDRSANQRDMLKRGVAKCL